MSVFNKMDEFGDDPAKPFLVSLNNSIGNLFSVLSSAKAALNVIGRTLVLIENTIKSISNSAKNAANAMRFNPLASGFLKIIAKIIMAFLKAAAKALDTVEAFVAGIRRAFFRTIKKRVEDLIDAIRKKILFITKIDGQIQGLISFIQIVARFLKEQEDKGHYPAAKLQEFETKFTRLFYDTLPPIEKIVSDLLKDLEPLKKAINSIKAEIDAVEKALSPFASIVATFNATIGYILRKVSDAATAVKRWIDKKVKWLGWLLDSMEWVINKAMKLLGIDRLIKWVKQQLGNVPFVKEAREYAEKLKKMNEQLEKVLKKIQEKLVNVEQQIHLNVNSSVKGHTDGTFVYIITLGIKKGLLEWLLPKTIKETIEKLIGTIDLLKKQVAEETSIAPPKQPPSVDDIQSIADNFRTIRDLSLSIADGELSLAPLNNIYAFVSESYEQFDSDAETFVLTEADNTANVERLEVKLQLIQHLEADADAVLEMLSDLREHYGSEFLGLFQDMEVGHAELVPNQAGLNRLKNMPATA